MVCYLQAEAVFVGGLDAQEEQPGGEGGAAWAPGAECQQENLPKKYLR